MRLRTRSGAEEHGMGLHGPCGCSHSCWQVGRSPTCWRWQTDNTPASTKLGERSRSCGDTSHASPLTVYPGRNNCPMPAALTRPATDRRIRFLSEKVVCRTAYTQQYSDGQDDWPLLGVLANRLKCTSTVSVQITRSGLSVIVWFCQLSCFTAI